jgi:hypothetical protein
MAMPPSMAASLEPVVEQPFVNHVRVETFIHQLMNFVLGPGLAESGQVLARVAVEHQLVVHDLVSMTRCMLLFREFVFRHDHRKVVRRIHVIQKFSPDFVFFM